MAPPCVVLLALVFLSGSYSAHLSQRDNVKPCVELADAFLDYFEFYGRTEWVPSVPLQEYMQWQTSIDTRDRDSVRDLICNTLVVDDASAVEYLERAGLLYAVTRRMYDMGIVYLQKYKPMISVMASWGNGQGPTSDNAYQTIVEMLDTLEEMGFTNLDPQGVAESAAMMEQLGMFGESSPGTGRRPVRDTSADASAETCSQLQPKLKQVLTASGMYGPVASTSRYSFGVNMQDEEGFSQLLCNITSSTTIDQIVTALRDYGVYNNWLEIIKSSMTQMWVNYKRFNEEILSAPYDTMVEFYGVAQADTLRERAVKLIRFMNAINAAVTSSQ